MEQINYQDFLAHHGVKGQKWGVQHGPPYPLKSGATFKKKKKLPGVDKVGSSEDSKGGSSGGSKIGSQEERKGVLDRLRERKEARKAKKEAKADAEREKLKNEAIKSDKASEMLKYKDRMSVEEMDNAINRINKIQKLEELKQKERTTLDDVMDKADKASKYMTTATNLYNNFTAVRDIYNTVSKKKVSDPKKEILKSEVDYVVKHCNKMSTDELKDKSQRVAALRNIFNEKDNNNKKKK